MTMRRRWPVVWLDPFAVLWLRVAENIVVLSYVWRVKMVCWRALSTGKACLPVQIFLG